MPTKANASTGVTVKVKIGAATVYTKVAGLKSFDGIGAGAAAVLDATDLDSVAKEKIMGIPDEGSMNLTFNFIADDAGQIAIQAARESQVVLPFEVAIKGQKYNYDGLILTAAPTSVGVDSIIELAVSVEISGKVTRAAVA